MAVTDGTSSTRTIPTVDISAWLSDSASASEKQRVVDDMSKACSTYGFFYLVGHGITPEMQAKALEVDRLFFSLPKEKRMEVWIGKSLGKSFRGYEPAGMQTHHEGLLPDTKETFMVGREVALDDPDCGTFSTGPNLWPTSLPDDQFRIPILEYQAKMLDLVGILLKILAQGLPKEWNCPEDVFDNLTVDPSIPMRFLHYAAQPQRPENQFGVADHTDFGCVSVLLQEPGTKGLEVWYPPTEEWVPVPVKEGAFVINMGDMMQIYTAGYYRSARHRVLTNTDKERHSVAFFLNGNLKLECKPLDGSGGETIVGEHIRQRLVDTMGKAGEVLQ
ncbi:citrinin biosynthesis oxygenase CtnA [Colletotrichum navitas]|uniref:Citrinin biosynthesis oxygenase CtnA n=1 Tax=Colletotrichum navitas TaxID=681940 RepID=A0AAD8PWB9_9PEZI|nr:citrinin biosynthesis oxygenase CtnA [Colletotrichum navitas]KAK1585902.1 citrinin biosynthesis oxygenase CtnA [Colletotrichum navitas]